MKSLIATICIIPLACGYIIGKSSSSSVKESQITSKTETRSERSKSHDTRTGGDGDTALRDSILGGRSISDVPASDLAAIFMKLSKHEPNADNFNRAKQAYQLQLLLSKLSSADLAGIATALGSDPETKNSDEIAEIISTLARKDPDRALDWIAKREDSSKLYPMIIRAIAEKEPLKAASLFSSAMADGKISKSNDWSITNRIAHSTAKFGADPFFSYMDSLPEELQGNLIYHSMSQIPECDRIKFLDQIYQRVQDGKLSGLEMQAIFSKAITEDKDAATAWFNKLPEIEQKNDFRAKAAQSLYQSGDKQAAAEWMKGALAAAPGKEKDIILKAIRRLRPSCPESVAFLANLLPEGENFSSEDIGSPIVDGSDEIAIMASAFSDPNEKSIFIANSIKEISQPVGSGLFRINSNDLDFLSLQIATMGLTGQNATRISDAIEAAKEQLSASHR